MMFTCTERPYIGSLMRLYRALKNGYRDDKYVYFCNTDSKLGTTYMSLSVNGTTYSALIHGTRDAGMMECSSDFEDVARDFCDTLRSKFWEPCSVEEIDKDPNYEYFSYDGKLWKVLYEMLALRDIKTPGPRRKIEGGASLDTHYSELSFPPSSVLHTG